MPPVTLCSGTISGLMLLLESEWIVPQSKKCYTNICLPIHLNSIQFSSIQFSSIQFSSIQFSSIQFNSIQFNSIHKLVRFSFATLSQLFPHLIELSKPLQHRVLRQSSSVVILQQCNRIVLFLAGWRLSDSYSPPFDSLGLSSNEVPQ